MASASIKRQRQKRRVDQDGDPEFQVAPMVDVLLVLMLFFMAITSTEVLKKENLHLPEANHAKPDDKNSQKKHNEVVVNVDWTMHGPIYTLDGQHLPTPNDVGNALGARYHQNPQSYVVIRADQNVEYSSISDIMNACATAGIETVSFAVITNPADAQKNPATAGAAKP